MRAFSDVNLVLQIPRAQRLRRHADLRRDRHDRLPAAPIQLDRLTPKLRRIRTPTPPVARHEEHPPAGPRQTQRSSVRQSGGHSSTADPDAVTHWYGTRAFVGITPPPGCYRLPVRRCYRQLPIPIGRDRKALQTVAFLFAALRSLGTRSGPSQRGFSVPCDRVRDMASTSASHLVAISWGGSEGSSHATRAGLSPRRAAPRAARTSRCRRRAGASKSPGGRGRTCRSSSRGRGCCTRRRRPRAARGGARPSGRR